VWSEARNQHLRTNQQKLEIVDTLNKVILFFLLISSYTYLF
jgi:hypothetical protein